MAEAIKSALNRRKSAPTDFSPGGDYSPLKEEFKPDSTRARFEELVNTYRNTNDIRGRALSGFDKSVGNGGSLLQLMSMVKGGELPPTSQISRVINKIKFGTMRENATTFQGRKVVDNLENSTTKGLAAFEEINGNDNTQEIIGSMNNIRKKTIDDRKEMTHKAKESTIESKSDFSTAGKDFLVLANGIGTSSSFRKALGDMFSLVSAMVQNKKLSGEDNQPLIDRVRNLIVEVRKDTSVRKSMSSLHSLYGTSFTKGSSAMKDAREKAEDHPALEDYRHAREHAKDLFSRMGNGYDVTKLVAALSAVGVMVRDNQNIRELIDNAKGFGDWAMNVDEDELTTDEFESRSKDLIHQSQSVFTEEDSKQFDTLSHEFKGYTHAVQENPVLVEYKNAMVGLSNSITGSGLDSEAREEHHRALRQDLMANIPTLMQTLRYVPLPRVAGQNKNLEFAADNIVLDMKHFVPKHISFDIHNEVYPRSVLLNEKSAMRSRQGYQGEQFYYLNITGVTCVAKRVAFYLKKKRGLPRIAEKGIADLIIGERGMDIAIRARRLHSSEKPQRQSNVGKSTTRRSSSSSSSSSDSSDGATATRSRKNTARELDIADVKVKLHHLDIRVHENKHNICSTLGIMLMRPVARKLIAKTIARSLTEQLLNSDVLLAKYGSTAHKFVASGASKAMSSVKTSAKKSVKKSKEQASKLQTKTKSSKKTAQNAAEKKTSATTSDTNTDADADESNSNTDAEKDPGTMAKEARKEAKQANERNKKEAKEKRSVTAEDKLQQQDDRRDSHVEQPGAETDVTQI
ncbi:hypothetical protein EV177_001402 [Coemansia sp. RSA 1804]|nr:hypothetical protein EV177_001402 [Coemansia sp. RSA 1804]